MKPWARFFDACVKCGLTKYKHEANGFCKHCRISEYNERKKAKAKKGLKADGTAKRGYTKTGERSKKSLTTSADNLARKDCHSRGYCEACEWPKLNPPKTTKGACGGGLQWCHIEGRRHKKIRWNPLNCLCMCAQCHLYFTDHSAEFGLFVEWLHPGRLAFLAELDRSTPRIDAQEWINYYKEKERKGA